MTPGARANAPENHMCLTHVVRRWSTKSLNRDFKVPTVKKPPPEHIASTLVAEVMTSNVSSRNGPQTIQTQISLQDSIKIPRDTVRRLMADIDPDSAETRYPGRRRQSKQRGHLTDTGVYYELHFDGHEKLNFKALRMGPVGIDIYGSRCHSSSTMVKFLVVPNARCSSTVGHYYLDLVEKNVFVQATVDGGSETGELYATHMALRQQCMPNISLDEAPGFFALKSTDNIPIESSGCDTKQVILLGKSLNYFHPALQLHIDPFNWLWPKIIQLRSSPNYICDFPERFGLTYFGVPAPQDLVDALRQNIPKSRDECYRWISDEFEAMAWAVHDHIGAPKFVLNEGWTIFCQMLPHFK
ncbi:hypothetical protein DFH09DRAFT_1244311 [Mycena vulgaris]|nr:hypothetical protein DFH09DRAFT_1244311 [Mycena vulgaris]